MTDPLAVVSIAALWLVAMGSLVVAYRADGTRIRREVELVHDARTVEQRSAALLDLVATCRALTDAIDRPGSIDVIETLDGERGPYEATVREHVGVSEIGVRVGDAAHRLQSLLASVEVYATDECRKAFDELRHRLLDSGFDPRAADRLAAIRRGKTAAIDSKDYQSAATARRLEREVLDDARQRLTLDLDETRALAERVVETARAALLAPSGGGHRRVRRR